MLPRHKNKRLHRKLNELDMNDPDDVMTYRRLRFERYLATEHNRTGPGEHGASVILVGDEQLEAQRRYKEEGFNDIASQKVALDRSIPDTRNPA